MDINRFWAIIEPGKVDEEPAKSLRSRLQDLDPHELESFQHHFDLLVKAAYQWSLWGAAYVIEGGCSDDGFTDFRYALISRGRDVYERALVDPDVLADAPICGDELFGYVAMDVYETKTGRTMPCRTSGPRGMPGGERWDFRDLEENRRRLPRVTERFGG